MSHARKKKRFYTSYLVCWCLNVTAVGLGKFKNLHKTAKKIKTKQVSNGKLNTLDANVKENFQETLVPSSLQSPPYNLQWKSVASFYVCSKAHARSQAFALKGVPKKYIADKKTRLCS